MSTENNSLGFQNSFLKKKSSRKIRLAPRYNKELDILKIKETFLDELFMKNAKSSSENLYLDNQFILDNFAEDQINSTKDEFKETINSIINSKRNENKNLTEYEKKYKLYVQEELTFNHFNLVNRIISDSINLNDELKRIHPLHTILYKIIKLLMMTELEIVYLSLFLEKYGWFIEEIKEYNKKVLNENVNKTFEISFEENLLFIAIFVKNYVNSNISFITDHLKIHITDFIEKLNYWSSIKLLEQNVFQITHIKLNEKYITLKRSYNTYCKANYIDYNFLVDEIIQMSQAYVNNEKNTENEGINKRKNELDLENLIKNKNLKNIHIFQTNNTAINLKIDNQPKKDIMEKVEFSETNKNANNFRSNIMKNDYKEDKLKQKIHINFNVEPEKKQELIKNPFSDTNKFASVLDLNALTLNHPFAPEKKEEINKDLSINTCTTFGENSKFIYFESNPPTQELIKSDSLINNINSAYPIFPNIRSGHIDETINLEMQKSTNFNIGISYSDFISKASKEINFSPSKLTESTLHYNINNMGSNSPFNQNFNRDKSKENEKEFLFKDESFFKSYSNFFYQNSYFVPKFDNDTNLNFEYERSFVNHNLKFKNSSSSYNIMRSYSAISNFQLQLKNEISMELLKSQKGTIDNFNNIFQDKNSLVFGRKSSDETQTEKSARYTYRSSESLTNKDLKKEE